MFLIPKFLRFGDGDKTVLEAIQPKLTLRSWNDLSVSDKNNALQYLINGNWVASSSLIKGTISILNHEFLQVLPGKELHYSSARNESDREDHASRDFCNIFKTGKEELVFRMLSIFAESLIQEYKLEEAGKQPPDSPKIKDIVNSAFADFDRLAFSLNHIFNQFSVNAMITRGGIVPRQDDRIAETIFEPVLTALSSPKWQPVSAELKEMFSDYMAKDYPAVISKAHNAVQKFLEIAVGSQKQNAKGALGKLFVEAKKQGILPHNRFVDGIIGVFQSFLVSERATKSDSKPATDDASPSDAVLVMNVVMVLLQYCLQGGK